MFVLLPYQHDRMSVKRLPWVSIAIFALNILVFALTHGAALEAQRRAEQALEPVYSYWIANPFVKTTPAFDARFPKPVSNLRRIVGKALEPPDPDILARQQAQFEVLIAAVVDAADSGHYARWGFVPSRPSAFTAITSQFVHAGWPTATPGSIGALSCATPGASRKRWRNSRRSSRRIPQAPMLMMVLLPPPC